jgi:hypothetical protein
LVAGIPSKQTSYVQKLCLWSLRHGLRYCSDAAKISPGPGPIGTWRTSMVRKTKMVRVGGRPRWWRNQNRRLGFAAKLVSLCIPSHLLAKHPLIPSTLAQEGRSCPSKQRAGILHLRPGLRGRALFLLRNRLLTFVRYGGGTPPSPPLLPILLKEKNSAL